MSDNDMEQGDLLFKANLGYKGKPSLLNGRGTYTIYNTKDLNINIGSLCLSSLGRWSLQIPSTSISLHGQYRWDLIEEADSLYKKFQESAHA
jgi:hypothetical protein